jgi:hypothetical protein
MGYRTRSERVLSEITVLSLASKCLNMLDRIELRMRVLCQGERLGPFGDAVHTLDLLRRVELTPITDATNSCRMPVRGEG